MGMKLSSATGDRGDNVAYFKRDRTTGDDEETEILAKQNKSVIK